MAENKNNGAAMAAEEPRLADPAAEAVALAEEAEAEAAEAEALAAAARARAKALRLRRQAKSAARSDRAEPQDENRSDGAEPQDDHDEDAAAGNADTLAIAAAGEDVTTDRPGEVVAAEEVDESAPQAVAPLRRGRSRVWRLVALVCTAVLVCALLAISGVMAWQHRNALAERHRSAEFAAAARQGVVSLMSMDFNHAKDDVQRVIDNSTGEFRDDFSSRADDFTKVVQESKVVTTATVNATAVQSMTDNSAVVLVSATSQVSNATGAKNEPREWRLAVSVTKDGGQLKMSKVEFVP
ncbi:MAG TPA: hypothetical protein VMU34_11680 [Mycobacterium sp.]|nr:hypothetical protein [Mycobacterium sp.]